MRNWTLRSSSVLSQPAPERSWSPIDLSPGRANCRDVDCRGVAFLPSRPRVDGVDLDEAVAFPECARGLIWTVAGRGVQRLRRHDANSGAGEGGQDVAKHQSSVSTAAAGSVHRNPQDLRPAGRLPCGDGKAGDGSGIGDDPGLVVGSVALDLRGHVGGEIVRQAADNGYRRWGVCGCETANCDHVTDGAITSREPLVLCPTRMPWTYPSAAALAGSSANLGPATWSGPHTRARSR